MFREFYQTYYKETTPEPEVQQPEVKKVYSKDLIEVKRLLEINEVKLKKLQEELDAKRPEYLKNKSEADEFTAKIQELQNEDLVLGQYWYSVLEETVEDEGSPKPGFIRLEMSKELSEKMSSEEENYFFTKDELKVIELVFAEEKKTLLAAKKERILLSNDY